MPVYFATTRDGVQFDGCVALNESNATAIITRRYTHTAKHFVGDREFTTEELLDGMRTRHMPSVPEDVLLTVEQRSEENAAVSSRQTNQRLVDAINAMERYTKQMRIA